MLTLNDGRAELWQWDTGRTLAVDADCSQVHFSNKVFGRSIDVDVVNGTAVIPDILLQTDKDLNVWAFVGTAENGYTKISKTFKVNRRNKPADYVFTPPEQTTLAELSGRLDKIEESQDPDAIKNTVEDYLEQNPVEVPVKSVNGKTGTVELNAEDVGAISRDDLQEATNEALAQAKASGDFDGADGAPGKDGADGQPGENGADGYSPTANVTQTDNGATITITDKNGTTTATVKNGKDGADGSPGADGADGLDGITPTIGDNGNWYLGETDTGKPSRGKDGATGATGATGEKGADGKSAYQYAVEGGYAGTEAEFAEKLASVALIVHVTGVNDNLSADKTYVDIRDAILAGTTVLVDRGELYLPLVSINTEYQSLLFGTTTCVNDDTGKMVYESLIEITQNDEVKDISALVDIPTTMPNPNALTFTGAVDGSYDGSAPLSVEIPSGGGASTDGGVGTGTYEFSVLASGTIPANTITAAEIGNGMIDTGITLGMLRQYKIFNMLYRCDSGNQYYCFAVGEPGAALYQCKRFFYDTPNAMNTTILWLDSARTAVLMLCATGNTRVVAPADVERMGSFGILGLARGGASMSAIDAYGNFADISDEAKIYVGVMHMNGQATNTKDFTWAICGVIK